MNCKETRRFSERLCFLMNERKVKVSDFADKIGRERQTIYNYRTGKTEPNVSDICLIAKYFGVTTDYLLGVDEQPTRPTKEPPRMFWRDEEITE